MEFGMALGFSIITGIISVFAFYFSFTKNPKEFYEASEEDTTGFILITGWIVRGLHKLHRLIFREHHIFALKITLFIFGIIFAVMCIGIWFYV